MKIIVEKGDSISSIAKALNTTPEEIKKINKLTTSILSIGDELIIEEDKKIEKIKMLHEDNSKKYMISKYDTKYTIRAVDDEIINKINEIIDCINNKD